MRHFLSGRVCSRELVSSDLARNFVASPSNPAEPLIQENRAHGIEPDFRTSSARYKRDDDIPANLILRALKRLDDLGPAA